MAAGKNIGDRTLPVIRIHDQDFAVDIRRLAFIQVDNPSNEISFRNVRDSGFYTKVTYDPVTKNAFKGSIEDQLMRKDLVIIKLPAAIDLDTGGLADEVLINVRKQREFKSVLETRSKKNTPIKKVKIRSKRK
jgi:hypothetical protein